MKSESESIQYRNGGRERFIRYAPVVIWIGLILFASSSSGASSTTSRFIRPLLEWLFPLASDETLAFYHGYIRKSAHLFIYGGLALLGFRAFAGSSVALLRRFPFLLSLILVGLVGALDEFNQSFNALRTGTPWDVVIDLVGGLCAGVLILVYRRLGGSKTPGP